MKRVKVKLKDKKLDKKFGKIVEEQINELVELLAVVFCEKCQGFKPCACESKEMALSE